MALFDVSVLIDFGSFFEVGELNLLEYSTRSVRCCRKFFGGYITATRTVFGRTESLE